MGVLLLMGVVAMVTVGGVTALELAVCDADVCARKLAHQCPRPHKLLEGTRHHISDDGLDCHCFCGLVSVPVVTMSTGGQYKCCFCE